MSEDTIQMTIARDGTGGAMVTAEGQHPVFSRIFANGQWLRVPLGGPANIPGGPLEIAWAREPLAAGWLSVRATLTNRGRDAIRLGSFHMMEGRDLGAEVPDPVVFLDSAGGWFAGAVKGKASCPPYLEKWQSHYIAEEDIAWAKETMDGQLEAGAHHSLSGLMVYYRGKEWPSWMLSCVVPMERCSAAPMMLIDPDTGGVRAFALINNFAGYELLPGESIATENLLLGRFSDPHKALETWADTCAAIREITVHPRPPVGWLSWYGYGSMGQNEADTLRTVDLIKEAFAGLGFEYMQLDYGYNEGNIPGDWFETNERYPNGLGPVAEHVAKRGFKFGVWVAPTCVAANSRFAKEHPEALFRVHPKDPKQWYWEPKPELFELDPTHPEGENFLRRIVRHFKAIGVRYFKFDFLGRLGRVDSGLSPHDKRAVKGVELYRRAQKIIMEEVAPDDYVYWCSNLLHFGIGLGSTSMVGCDIGNPFHFGFSRGEADHLAHFRAQATTTISRYYLHEKMVRLNPDSMHVAPPANIEECRMRATLVAMSGGQMFLSDRFDLSEKDRFDIIRQVTPPYGHVARPLDLFEHVYPEAHPRIWHLPVDTGWDRRQVVALMNGEHDMTIEVDLKTLGLSPETAYHVWEFWEQEYVGKVKGSVSLSLRCPSCRLLAIVEEEAHPWVLSTDFHFSQGGCELAQVAWDEQQGVLSGVLLRPRGERGALVVTAPAGYRPVYPYLACPEEAGADVYRYAITATSAETPWRLEFEKPDG